MNIVENQLWYKNAIYYEVYVRAFYDSNGDGHGDLPGLTQKLDYLKELGVDCLWLLPVYPSPLKDDGYDIADYYGVIADYGTLEDLKKLVESAHARGIRIIMDLVLNHTSDQHPWFQAARADRNSPYRDYYVWSDTNQKYMDARIIFVDTEKSNWAWDETAGQYYWHRFYSSQPDLNYENSAVRKEMLKVMEYWLDIGIDGFRADAVPYLLEREGTNCENLPETHAYLKEVRGFIEANYPGRILLAEANQWPEEVRPYFGEGDEFHMGFHFPLMPRIFMALQKEDRSPIKWILERTPDIPPTCQWCTFLRNHDELTLEMVTEEERHWMWDEYAPLAYSLLFTLPGSPNIYYGDEIGMGDNIWLPDRDGVRTPMQWENSPEAGFSQADHQDLYAPVIDSETYGPERVNVAAQRADPGSLYNALRKMISIRKGYGVFGWGSFEWAEVNSSAVAAYWREYKDERILILNNLSSTTQDVEVRLPRGGSKVGKDLLSDTTLSYHSGENLSLTLDPYDYRWVNL
jgi:maltose alpha-D-glucosyltransferase/alpha-amylase